jgi:hypothetical protein
MNVVGEQLELFPQPALVQQLGFQIKKIFDPMAQVAIHASRS